MIIGIDASRANLDHKTGVEWYGYYVIRWLAKIDKKNQYILYTNKPLKCGLLDLRGDQFIEGQGSYKEELYDRKGYQLLKSPGGNFKGKILEWPFEKFWTQGRFSLEFIFRKKIDVFFVPSHVLPLIHPKNSIATIHDIGFEKNKRLYKKETGTVYIRFLKSLLNHLVRFITLFKYSATAIDYLKWSSRFTLKNSKKVITVSNFTKNELIKIYNSGSDKISVIHNGYNKFLYKKIDNKKKINSIKNLYGIDSKYLLYVGRLEKKKNITKLIEAYQAILEENKDFDYKLVLIGKADYGYDEIQYLINQYRLGRKIIIPGWIKECDLPYIFNGASLFVFPSRYEGFGIPLLQAMACGVPVVASHVASIPEVVDDAALLFNPESSDSIKNSILEMLNNEETRKSYISKGLERVKIFSWEKCARETAEVLQNLIK